MNISARGFALAGAIVLLGAAGQWLGGDLLNLWRLPAGAALLLLWLEHRDNRQRTLVVQRELPPQALLGHTLHGRLRITNPGDHAETVEYQPFPPAGIDGEQPLLRATVAAGGQATLEFQAVPTTLGDIEWPSLHLRRLGRFGLAWWKHVIPQPQTLTVQPDRYRQRLERAGSQQGGEREQPRVGAGLEFQGLREYQPGDPLRTIDWKATARGGRPFVRKFSEEQQLELLIVLDVGYGSGLQSGNLSYLHHYVNVASRLAEMALLQNSRCGLLAFADDIIEQVAPDRGERALRRIRHTLSRLDNVRRESNPLTAAMAVRRMLKQRGLVVWFSEIDDPQAAAQLLRATTLLAAKHLPLIATIKDAGLEKAATQPAERWFDPYRNYAALELARAKQLTLHRLQRMGAHVLQAHPAQLDAAVLEHYGRLRRERRV